MIYSCSESKLFLHFKMRNGTQKASVHNPTHTPNKFISYIARVLIFSLPPYSLSQLAFSVVSFMGGKQKTLNTNALSKPAKAAGCLKKQGNISGLCNSEKNNMTYMSLSPSDKLELVTQWQGIKEFKAQWNIWEKQVNKSTNSSKVQTALL